MNFKVTVKIEMDGKHKTYQLNETQEAVKNDKTGKVTLSHHQPAANNPVLKSFSKLYIDTVELTKAFEAEKVTKS